MAHILYAWELGSGLGHIDRMLVAVRQLRARGHTVQPVLRDLSRAHQRLGAEGFASLQAPVWLPQLAHPPALGNYTAVLAAAGWLDAQGLAGLLTGWRRLFDLVRPDWLVCDHAPTALLAARGLGLSVHAVGNSFELPPLGPAHAPQFPAMAFWDAAQQAKGAEQDDLLRNSANRALALLGDAPLPHLPALFDGVNRVIVSVPELAHYDGYAQGTEFIGPMYVGDKGMAPVWPADSGPRVFAYLAPTHHEFAALMAALRERPLRALVFARGLSAEAATRLGGPGIRFETQPLHMGQVLAEADLVVSHASLGTVVAAALAGKPQLALPNHMEQHMVARRIEQAGIGRAVLPRSQGNPYGQLLAALLDQPGAAAAARALAQRLAGQTPERSAQRLVSLLESHAGGGAAGSGQTGAADI
jgi:UDP:flavonoid glycosyltransferase YjiC (YdhE family)